MSSIAGAVTFLEALAAEGPFPGDVSPLRACRPTAPRLYPVDKPWIATNLPVMFWRNLEPSRVKTAGHRRQSWSGFALSGAPVFATTSDQNSTAALS